MKLVRFAALCAAASLAFASVPAQAQEWPVVPGEYVEISMIKVDDGHALDYANHLAGQWRKSQDFAKAQGWITGYEILENSNPRADEPDLYLVTRFKAMADPAEAMRRDKAFNDYMKSTSAQMQAESGKRATYRKLMGSMLLRQQVWAK